MLVKLRLSVIFEFFILYRNDSDSYPPEVPSQIQPAFVKHTRKYYSINQLMDIILPKYPNIKTLVVLYDEMIQGKYQKVNIKPLTAVVINQNGTRDKLDYAKLMYITKGLTDISVPKWYFDNVSHDNSIISNSGDLILRLLHQKHVMVLLPIISYNFQTKHLVRIK